MERTLSRFVRVTCILSLIACTPLSVCASGSDDKYQAAIQALEPFIARQVEDKQLPALSIALVDDQRVVWSKGFGFADRKAKAPATSETVYRVGSVSKLFTDIAIMQLVEQGKLDLDAPVQTYLPDFKPRNAFAKPITLRQMMSHRSGLVREPPVGNYFDPDNPSLAQMVASLNKTDLVYRPGDRIKYSNAAIATVGYVLEVTQKQPFGTYVKRAVLEPLGMKKSAFEATPAVTKDLAHALMWTYQGREFDAPTFELGMAPAGSMYSTVTDLSRFLGVLFAEGMIDGKSIIGRETLRQMLTPQFAKPADKTGFGIGFMLGELNGKRRVGHGGAMYGFSTELAALPDDKLGVVVVSARDVTNAVTTHIADQSLRHMLAVRQNQPLPKIEETKPVELGRARKLAGRYRSGDKVLDLDERAGNLSALSKRGGFRLELRASGDDLVIDDRLEYGLRIMVDGDKLIVGRDVYERVPDNKPAPAPSKWLGLIGEYGWDHNTQYIFEKDGQLHSLIEWVFIYPLKEVSEDVYEFPDFGLYHGERLIFKRDRNGRATEVEAAKVVFKRRDLDGENGETFRIKPIRPLDELRTEAIAAKPPSESGEFREPELVDLTTLDDTIKLDIRYATSNNFLSTPFYTSAKAFMQRPAALALARVHKSLSEKGYGLLIHDAYRPWYVTKMFWEATPEKQRIFVADPSKGSRHNRGCAVDLTLYDLQTGKAVQMVGGYDEMSDRSYPAYIGGTSLQRWHQTLLRRAMENEGFSVYEAEWWHFDFKDWKKYPIMNVTFEKIRR